MESVSIYVVLPRPFKWLRLYVQIGCFTLSGNWRHREMCNETKEKEWYYDGKSSTLNFKKKKNYSSWNYFFYRDTIFIVWSFFLSKA